MALKTITRKIIVNDPIHNVMSFGSNERLRKAIKAVVDTLSFQRLRRISQLGLASYVFPGATHTRFCHSLGAAYLAHTVLTHLAEKHSDCKKEIVDNAVAVTISALLHDAGHGPFSHSFEHVLEGIKGKIDVPMHEDWTGILITSKKSDVHGVLKKSKLNPVLVSSPFVENSDECFPDYLKQIVSSQIDVDRMDYLLRDSHFAGVSIGKIDVQYIINCLHIVKHSSRVKTLGLTPKGVKAYESFAVARQLMNRSVYYHRKIKVMEYMVESLFRSVISNSSELGKIAEISPHIPSYLTSVSKVVTGKERYSGKLAFMEKHLHDYFSMTEDSFWVLARKIAENNAMERKFSHLKGLAMKILSRTVVDSFEVEKGKEILLEGELIDNGLKKGEDFDIVRLESTMYKQGAKSEKVFVVGWDELIEEISTQSELLTAFRDRPETEQVLVVINEAKAKTIERVVKEFSPKVVKEHSYIKLAA